MRAILAIDSFKGCLTSAEAEEAARAAFPEGETVSIPVSDGGEGFSRIVTAMLGGTMRSVLCSDPLGRPVEASYG
ncbi:MAG: glycerate kinase, partial [Bacteroidales bacterium]|nr:glycerate kinase [Bacteroidales bacterium]